MSVVQKFTEIINGYLKKVRLINVNNYTFLLYNFKYIYLKIEKN